MIENSRDIAGPWLLVLKIARWLDFPGRLAGKAAAWLFLPMILIIVFDAVGRKYLRKLDFVIANNLHGYLNSPVLQDAEWHLHAVIFLVALGFAYSRNVHVRLDIFRHKFSDRGRLWLELLGGLIILFPFLAVLLNYGWEFFVSSWNADEGAGMSNGLDNRWAIKFFLVLGPTLLFFSTCSLLLRLFVRLFGPPIFVQATQTGQISDASFSAYD